MSSFRLAILDSHPIQYFAPLYRRLAKMPEVDLTVYYCHRQGVEHYLDEGFQTLVKWDVPLLDGYHSEFLPNWRNVDRVGVFFCLISGAGNDN